jgi:uncharacterized protein involved in exopolysaccharide biosynthesis
MAPQERNLDSDAADDDSESEGLDFERIKLLAGFFVRAQSRHRFVGPLVFVIVAALTVAVTVLWPRVYEVDFRLLAQKNNLLPALGNPTRTVRDNDSPTKNVQETVVQRDNLVALVKQVDLIDRWDASRAPILRIKDKITNAIGGPTSEEDKMHALIGLMQQRLWVTTDDSSLTFTVIWPSPQIAFEISSLIEQNFLEAKYDNEVSVIREAIRILDDRAKDQAKQVDAALADLTKLEADQKAKAEASAGLEPAPAPAPAEAVPGAAPAPRVVRKAPPVPVRNEAADQLEDVRKQIATLEASRARDLADAQKQLGDARLTLGPLHPTVVALKQKVDQASEPDPQLAALKTQEHQLVAAIAATPSPSDDGSPGTTVTSPVPRALPRTAAPADSKDAVTRQLVERLTDRDDAATAFAKTKLTAASAKYNELLTRLEAAQIELDVAKAAFKFKYEVVRPPEFPKKPRKPNVPVLLLGGILAAFLLAFLIPGLVDLASGRLLEPWQAQNALKIPVIGILLPPGS